MTSILYRIFVLGLPLVFFLSYLAPQAYLTYGFSTNKGNFQAVTNQTNLNGDGKLTVTVAGNTHLVGASMVGQLGTDLTTGTLTTQHRGQVIMIT